MSVKCDTTFNQTDIDIMRGYMEQNMNISQCYTGFTLPQGINNTNRTNQPFAHFVDIASFAYLSLALSDSNGFNNATINEYFQDYVTWITHIQSEQDSNSMNIEGEPLFMCDANPYNGGWCRPQNDGPATRSQAIIFYANWLLLNRQSDYVEKYLYVKDTPGTSPGIFHIFCDIPSLHRL